MAFPLSVLAAPAPPIKDLEPVVPDVARDKSAAVGANAELVSMG